MADPVYEYEYPDGLDLKPGSPLSEKIVKLVDSYVKKSRSGRGRAHESWKKLVHLNEAYIDHGKKNANGEENIVINAAGALEETFLAYQRNVMLSSREWYPMSSKGGWSNHISVALLERVVQTQAIWFNHEQSHITHWRDMWRYGTGAMAPVWTQRKCSQYKDWVVDPLDALMLRADGLDYIEGDVIRYSEERVDKEGSELRNIDVFNLLLDPDTPVQRYQEARFCGYIGSMDSLELIRREENPEERLFNARYVRDYCESNRSNRANMDGWNSYSDTGRGDHYGISKSDESYPGSAKRSNVCIAFMFINLIPKEYNLSDRTRPQRWMISVANNKTIIQCEPLNLDYDEAPIIIGSPTSDGYDVWSVSSEAKAYGLYKMMDWLIRAEYAAQRSSLTQKTIMDFSILDEEDVMGKGGSPGIIRVKKGVIMGDKSIRDGAYPLPVPQLTGNNFNSIDALFGLTKAVQGADNLVPRMPERPGQNGVDYFRQKGSERLQFISRMIVSSVWPRLVNMLGRHTLQFMDSEMVYSIVGSRYQQDLLSEFEGRQSLKIDKSALESEFDYMPIDPTLRLANMETVRMMLERAMSIPETAVQVLSKHNWAGIFEEVARRDGFEDIHDWAINGGSINTGIVPPEELAAGVESGRYEPMGVQLQ